MMKCLGLPVIVILALILQGCSKDEGVCVSSTGKVIREERLVLPYRTVEIYDNINLFLTCDSTLNRIVVEAGENIQAGITTHIDSGRLVLRNTNSCNWLRSFKVPINVYLTFNQLDTIIFRAAGNITCLNEWKGHSIKLDIVEGSGDINLKLNTYRTDIQVSYGTTSIVATGITEVATLVTYGFGPFHAEDLISKFTYVSSYSSNDLFICANLEMAVEIGNIGNVYYRGDPAVITTKLTGDGKLIKL